MQNDFENAQYNKFLVKNSEDWQQNNFAYQQMKKSSDSLYMQLQRSTQEDQKSRLNLKINHPQPINYEKHSFQSKNQDFCKINLISKLQKFPFSSKKQSATQNMLAHHPNKAIKPSTPTCNNAQSSLNFLKNRKNQIIMNQSQGLTLNNLQLIRKSRSKSYDDQKMHIKSNQQRQKLTTVNNKNVKQKFDSHVNSLNSFKKQHLRSSSQKLERIYSASNEITNSIWNEFYPKKYLPYEKQNQRKNRFITSLRNSYERELANSFKSSTSKSIKSLNNSFQSDLSSARSCILKSISGKLTQSRVLRNIEAERQKRIEKQDRNSQHALQKRLKNLQHILSQLQIKPSQKNETRIIDINKKTPTTNKFSVISHLREQINLLQREARQLRERYLNISLNQFKRNQQIRNLNVQHKNPQLKSQREKQAKINLYPSSLKVSRNNPHFISSFSKPSPIKICNDIRKQSPLRVTFHYHNISNPKPVLTASTRQNPQNADSSFLQQSSNPYNPLNPSQKFNSFGYFYQNNLTYSIQKNIQSNSSQSHRNSNNIHSRQTRVNLPQSKLKLNEKNHRRFNNLSGSHSQKESDYFKNKQLSQTKRYSTIKTSTSNSINSPFIKPY